MPGMTVGNSRTVTDRIEAMRNGATGARVSYNYDENGNITKISEQPYGSSTVTEKARYTYDEQNQLIREDNAYLNKSYLYSYDKGGNMTEKGEYAYTTAALGNATKTYTYTYGDSNWPDKLTSFDSKAITHDNIGNPLSYNGYTYSWENGRQLSSITGPGGLNLSFTYDSNGIRQNKIYHGPSGDVITKYVTQDGKILSEISGNSTKIFTYDENDRLISMKYNGNVYYYFLNQQGDVLGLWDESGNVVASYTYDAWGNATLSGSMSNVNPFRYRGYYYDYHIGMYYCQSRYYMPTWGRWLNAEDVGNDTLNLFEYCRNNPVNYVDSIGLHPSRAGWQYIGYGTWQDPWSREKWYDPTYYDEKKSWQAA